MKMRFLLAYDHYHNQVNCYYPLLLFLFSSVSLMFAVVTIIDDDCYSSYVWFTLLFATVCVNTTNPPLFIVIDTLLVCFL